jgi:hypothetical protein
MDPVFANAVTFAGTDMSDGCRSGVSCKGIRNRNHGTDITPKESSTGAGYAVLAHSQRGGRTDVRPHSLPQSLQSVRARHSSTVTLDRTWKHTPFR